jgi:hypothetical protein
MTTYDPILRKTVEEHFPELLEHFGPIGWLWIKAQCWVESRLDPKAVSPVGAAGLMQLMPATDLEIDGEIDGTRDPEGNIRDGVRYLALQYRRLAEVTPHGSRLRLALASYNGGRGYVNMALALARQDEGLPFGYSAWREAGSPAGYWQTWEQASRFLQHPCCLVRGRLPDYRQILDYVERIDERAQQYLKEVTACPNPPQGAAAPTA